MGWVLHTLLLSFLNNYSLSEVKRSRRAQLERFATTHRIKMLDSFYCSGRNSDYFSEELGSHMLIQPRQATV